MKYVDVQDKHQTLKWHHWCIVYRVDKVERNGWRYPNRVHYYEPVTKAGQVSASTYEGDAKTFATIERAQAYAELHGLQYRSILPLHTADKLRWNTSI